MMYLFDFSGCPILPAFGRVGELTSLPVIGPAQESIPFLDPKKPRPCKQRKDAAPSLSKSKISKSRERWPPSRLGRLGSEKQLVRSAHAACISRPIRTA